ncbi:Uncharacterised protein [Candidatus Venteria ishoeyi]|uniref:Uncharacterized protein n=1 Tax=Candidatus Venteria ishoeyi TaxID=1899563 RepID=A0A1H6FAZ6_9GAMM|nr:Uncharacterised protein [Candidatus Venteria ishoeyi]
MGNQFDILTFPKRMSEKSYYINMLLFIGAIL